MKYILSIIIAGLLLSVWLLATSGEPKAEGLNRFEEAATMFEQ